MSHDCPTYVPPGADEGASQIKNGGTTGPVDCAAWSGSRAIADVLCGRRIPSGRTIRLLSDEPVPDRKSPGLNLEQIRDVAADDYGVWVSIQKNIAWSTVESYRRDGRGIILPVGYAPVADSKYDAGRGFRGNHMLYERIATYDPLADGRASGVWAYDGSLYSREVIKRAAGALDLGGGRRVGYGRAWIGVTRDLMPDFRCHVDPGAFLVYDVSPTGYIYGRHEERTASGFTQDCSPPHVYRVHSTAADEFPAASYNLVRVLAGARAGKYIGAKYAEEM